MSSENVYSDATMSSETNIQEDDGCLCHGVVPKEQRVDFDQIVTGKDGKSKWKTVLRYHQECPVHGVNVRETIKNPPTE